MNRDRILGRIFAALRQQGVDVAAYSGHYHSAYVDVVKVQKCLNCGAQPFAFVIEKRGVHVCKRCETVSVYGEAT